MFHGFLFHCMLQFKVFIFSGLFGCFWMVNILGFNFLQRSTGKECILGLAITYWVAHNFFSFNLIFDRTQTLILIWVVQSPIVILLYSLRQDPPFSSSFPSTKRTKKRMSTSKRWLLLLLRKICEISFRNFGLR